VDIPSKMGAINSYSLPFFHISAEFGYNEFFFVTLFRNFNRIQVQLNPLLPFFESQVDIGNNNILIISTF